MAMKRSDKSESKNEMKLIINQPETLQGPKHAFFICSLNSVAFF